MAAFTVIDHTELGAAAASYTVTGIPSTYDHLLLEVSARLDLANTYADVELNFNGEVSGTNYSTTYMRAVTTTLTSARTSGTDHARAGNVTCDNILADSFGALKIWIPNYANTTGFKSFFAQSAVENNSTSNYYWALEIDAGLWSSTAAIDEIFLDRPTNDFMQYSTFTLYGVTGA